MFNKEYPQKVDQIYDKYVEFYNNFNSKLSAFSELSNIYNGVKDEWDFRKSMVEDQSEMVISTFLFKYAQLLRKKHSITMEDAFLRVKDHQNELNELFNKIFDDCYGVRDSERDYETIELEFKSLATVDLSEFYSFVLQMAFDSLKEHQKLTPNLHAITTIRRYILDQEYPPELKLYKELSKDQQDDIAQKFIVRRPELPQTEIEKLISNLIKKVDDKGTYTHERNGKKKNYQVIHPEESRWSGYNINQIYTYFLDVHPDLTELITDVAFKGRIQKAIDYTK